MSDASNETPRRRGRPKGSKNKPKNGTTETAAAKRKPRVAKATTFDPASLSVPDLVATVEYAKTVADKLGTALEQ